MTGCVSGYSERGGHIIFGRENEYAESKSGIYHDMERPVQCPGDPGPTSGTPGGRECD
jgi:hypothetical protein